jgi:hypothetical protein
LLVRAREIVLSLEANIGPNGGGLISEEVQAKIGPQTAQDFKMLAALLKKLEAIKNCPAKCYAIVNN